MNNKHSDKRLINYMDEDEVTKPAFRINSKHKSSRLWEKIFLSKKPRTYPKGSIIVSQSEENNNIFYLISGLIEYTYNDKTGAESLMEVLGEGSMLNLQPVFGKNSSIATFAALTESSISSLSKDEMWEYMSKDKCLVEELLEEMAIIVGGLNRQLCMSTENTNHRTKQVICMLAENQLRSNPSAKKIQIKLSQDDLARITRTSRVTIAKILSDLRQQGMIETDYGEILITDIDALKLLAAK
jgi:CRP-like cAMP-binding protein